MRNFLARFYDGLCYRLWQTRQWLRRLRYTVMHRAVWQEIEYIENWLAENTEDMLYDSQHIDYLDDEIAMLRDEMALIQAALGVRYEIDPARLNGKEISTGFVTEAFDQEW